MTKGNSLGSPLRLIPLIRSPCHIGKKMRVVVYSVIFHDVDFTARRPLHRCTQRPNGRPRTAFQRYSCPYFKTAIQKLLLTCRFQRRRSIFDKWSRFSPIGTSLFVEGIRPFFASSFNNQFTILAIRIVFLIPLQLVVAYKPLFKTPIFGIRFPIFVKLIAPYQCIFLCDKAHRKRQKNTITQPDPYRELQPIFFHFLLVIYGIIFIEFVVFVSLFRCPIFSLRSPKTIVGRQTQR